MVQNNNELPPELLKMAVKIADSSYSSRHVEYALSGSDALEKVQVFWIESDGISFCSKKLRMLSSTDGNLNLNASWLILSVIKSNFCFVEI